jgi:hypothetical protein
MKPVSLPHSLTIRSLALLSFAVLPLAGCGGNNVRSDRSSSNTFPAQPADIVPERVLVANEPLEDRDLNGYVDTIRAVVYVFGDTNRYPLPITVEATFQFRLTGERGDSLGVWAFAPRESSRAAFPTQPGPAYGFEINLNAVGTDRHPAQAARLTCEVTTADGTRVASREPLEVRIGGRAP